MEEHILKLTVLESTDIHGFVFPVNYANNKRKELGLGKIATIIKEERKNSKNLILIDNGDILQGTPLTYYYAKINDEGINPLIKVLNSLKYDCAVLGNHEFNYGKKLLFEAVKASKFPWLSANIIDENTGEPLFGKPYIIKEFYLKDKSLKVGILGLTTQYIPNWENASNISGIKFLSAVEEGEKWIKLLREQEKVDVLIVSYHGGFERDLDTGEPSEKLTGENEGYKLCMKYPEIDVLLTGHQHRVIENKRINGVLVLQPGSYGQYLGKINISLRYENGWKIVGKSSELILVKYYKEDLKILESIKSYEDNTQKWLDTSIGEVEGDMTVKDPMEVRLKDHALIEFINKVQMENGNVDISSTSLFDNSAKGFNGKITMRDIVSNYIYPNTLKVLRVKGEDIKEALERSACYFQQYEGGDIKVSKDFTNIKIQHYNYDMWEGINYKLDISKPIGSRVVELYYKGKPVEMHKDYDVVMNNYRASGGGEYTMFKNKPIIKDIPIDMAELIANYILERKVIKAEVDNNWEVVTSK